MNDIIIEVRYLTNTGCPGEARLYLDALCEMGIRDFRKALILISKDYENHRKNASLISCRLDRLFRETTDPKKKAAYQKKEEIRRRYLPSWKFDE